MSTDLGWNRLLGAGSLAVLGLVAGCTVGIAAGADETSAHAARAAWPMFNGPCGNFVPLRFDVQLVDDLADARLLWVSEEEDIGIAKGPYGPQRIVAEGASPHPGGRSSPIVAEGTVYVAFFRPVGPPYSPESLRTVGTRAEAPETWWDIWAIDAHDVVVAIDAETGRTKWKAIEQRKGVRTPGLKRGGWGVSPVYHDGRVYHLGTTARLYCYDAQTGAKIWEQGLGRTHELAEQAKAAALEQQRFGDAQLLSGWLSSLVVAADVLICPTFTGSPRGLAGVDPENGEILWEIGGVLSKFSTPAVVRLEGREYLLANSGRGELRLIDPRSGEVLWTVEGLGPMLSPLGPSDSHVLVNVRPDPETAPDGRYGGRWGAYRFDLGGAELAWKLPDEAKYDFKVGPGPGTHRKVVIRDGIVWLGNSQGLRDKRYLFVIGEETGEVLQEVRPLPETPEKNGFNQILLCGDHMMTFYDVVHNDRQFGASWFDISGGRVERLSHGWIAPHFAATGSGVPIEVPYYDGRIYLRTSLGAIVCYDLRNSPNNQVHGSKPYARQRE